jgi:hypothetical protein
VTFVAEPLDLALENGHRELAKRVSLSQLARLRFGGFDSSGRFGCSFGALKLGEKSAFLPNGFVELLALLLECKQVVGKLGKPVLMVLLVLA